jgi:hypothetical protein
MTGLLLTPAFAIALRSSPDFGVMFERDSVVQLEAHVIRYPVYNSG